MHGGSLAIHSGAIATPRLRESARARWVPQSPRPLDHFRTLAAMQNVEFKAELRDPALARSIALASGAIHALSLNQVDTYYRIADARLKRRETSPAADDAAGTVEANAGEPDTEFIYYDRSDRSGPRLSRFTIYTPQQAADRFGVGLPDPWVVVKKSRQVFLLDGVRIHLDQVENLGAYIEFEAPVVPDRKIPGCFQQVDRLRELFRPAMGEAIDCSYSDLLAPPTQA
jgi:adenylate cyclase, class 2